MNLYRGIDEQKKLDCHSAIQTVSILSVWLWLSIGQPDVQAQLIPSDLERMWYGEMDTDSRVFQFVVRAKRDIVTDPWMAGLMSLDEGGMKLPLENVAIDNNLFSFELPATLARYSGSLDNSNNAFHGKWTQAGNDFDLNFRVIDAIPCDQPDEVWVGELNAGLQKLTLQLRVYRGKPANQKVMFDSLTQGAGGFKATWIRDNGEINFSVPAIQGTFKGTLGDDQSQIVGEWNQGTPLPLTWIRREAPISGEFKPPNRPQKPQAPFPYENVEVSVRNEQADIDLAGTLTIPPTIDQPEKRWPAAILISGSGPQDRDETLFGHKPFWVLADHLTRQGIAVLRFDERGVGNSTGQFEPATITDFADDVEAAFAFLAKQPAIDSKQIGLIGHSEGGLVAPLVASRNPDIAWIVLMAGPGVNGEQILYSQGKLIIESGGGTPQDVVKQRMMQEVAFAAIGSLDPQQPIDPIIEPIVDELIGRLQGSGDDVRNSEGGDTKVREGLSQLVRANAEQMHRPWFRFFAQHEPGPVLERVRCPVLAINGEKDVQVDPKLNLPKIAESLRAGGNRDFETIELPNLNHMFQTAQSGSLSDYPTIEET